MTPCEGTNRVTSCYGWRTLRGVRQWHAGQDIVAENRRLRAIWDAVKVEVALGWNGGRGNLVRLYYSATLRVIYQHLNDIYVAAINTVKQGDAIAQMGWSGDCVPQGPGGMHLHIEVQTLQGGVWRDVNPAQYTEVPNAAGSHPGNDNLDKVRATKPAVVPADTSDIKVGDKVQFGGTGHWTQANGGDYFRASAGDAVVQAIQRGTEHPFHLIHVEDGTSTVYGWVKEADVAKYVAREEPAPATPTRYKKGGRLTFTSGYVRSADPVERALHVAKKQLLVNKGIVADVLTNGARNPLKMVGTDGKTPICWCNDGDISGRW